jgi:poly(3-hydroxyalkanoate) depolymerase
MHLQTSPQTFHSPQGPTLHALSLLSDVEVQPTSGLHIGYLTLGEQILRVGIRPGAPSSSPPSSPPLLIFNGIGANMELVNPLLHAMEDVEAIIFDVPGAGKSPPPKRPYRLCGMARLARKLLEHLGYTHVDVMGVSWGGGLAQQFAIQYPKRVRKLILAATSMGAAAMVPGHPRVLLKMLNPRRYSEPGYMRRVGPTLYGGTLREHPHAIDVFTRHVRGGDAKGYRYQLLAMAGWSSLPWLWRIRHPVLILAGNDDPLVPLINARLHAFLLHDAHLHIIEDGHLFMLTKAHHISRLIAGFLDNREPPHQ